MHVKLFAPFQKIEEQDDGTVRIHGIASSETTDLSGEIIKASAISGALPDFFRYGTGNLREMHGLSAAGTIDEAQIDNENRTMVIATVVDDMAVRKIRKGVYKGLSIGGRVLERDPKNPKTITKISLSEISLVDRPCNPDSVFEVWKAAFDHQGDIMDQNPEAAATSPELATPPAGDPAVETVETAKADVAQEATTEAVEADAGAPASDDAETEKAAMVDPEPVAEAPAEEVAKTDETEVTKVDAEVETPTEAIIQKSAAEKAADAVAALEALAKTDEPEDVQKGMYSVCTFAQVLSQIASMMQEAEYEAEYEADNSPVPPALRDWLNTGVSIFKEMAVEEVNELVAAYSAKAAAKGDLNKTEDAAGAEADVAKAASADEALAKAQADNEVLKADLAKRDEAFEAIADRITKANEEITKKLAAKLDETTKALEETQDRLTKVEEAPLPPKTTVLPVGITAISKADDAAGLGATAAPVMTQEQAKAALDAMSPEDRANILIKASLKNPIFLGR